MKRENLRRRGKTSEEERVSEEKRERWGGKEEGNK